MVKRLELVVEYDANSLPAAARCRLCGESMPQGEPGITSASANILWFAQQFTIHNERKHPREGFSQATPEE